MGVKKSSAWLMVLMALTISMVGYLFLDADSDESTAITLQHQRQRATPTALGDLAPALRSKETAEHRDVIPGGLPFEVKDDSRIESAAVASVPTTVQYLLDVIVLDADGRPIEGAKVHAEGLIRTRDSHSSSVHAPPTDSRGRTGFSSLPLDQLRVVASANGYAPKVKEVMRPVAVGVGEPLEFLLGRGGSVMGKLLDIRGEAADFVRLSIHLTAWPGRSGRGTINVMQSTHTDAEGQFQFTRLAPGSYRLYTRAMGANLERVPEQSLEVEVREGEATEVVFADLSQSFVKLTGIVLHNGLPLTKARLYLSWTDRSRSFLGKRCKTDDEGRFEVLLDEAGSIRVQISQRGKLGSVFREITVPDVETHDIEIAIDTGSLAGHVYGPDGTPVADYHVTAFGRSSEGATGSSINSTQTNADGFFEFTDLLASTYSIKAGRLRATLESDSSRTSYPHLGNASIAGIEVDQGQSVAGIELRLSAAAAIAVRLLDSEGRAVENAKILCRPDGESIHMATRSTTNAAGEALLGGLGAGQYSLRATRHLEASTWISCQARLNETAGVDLILEPAASIRVSIFQGDQPAEHCYLRAYDMNDAQLSSQSVRGGSVVIGPWTPGSYRLVAKTDGNQTSTEQTVELLGTGTVEVRLQLE